MGARRRGVPVVLPLSGSVISFLPDTACRSHTYIRGVAALCSRWLSPAHLTSGHLPATSPEAFHAEVDYQRAIAPMRLEVPILS